MNDFTKDELELMNNLSRPKISFSIILKIMNEKAIELGYLSHDDFLIKTGWKKRFCNE